MTPAERIAAAFGQAVAGWPWWRKVVADDILDALCPKGERIVLDRTGDTDRLIRQVADDGGCRLSFGKCSLPVRWVDSPEGSEQ